MTTTSTSKKPAARKAATKKSPTKSPAERTASPKRAPAKKQPPAVYDAEAVVARIAELRAEGIAWRPLSATLNEEGITTVRGKRWSANGTTAFTLAKKNGID